MNFKIISRKFIVAFAFFLAGLLTLVGWSQTLAYKVFPAYKLAFWFPLITMTNAMENGFELALSIIQFPLFATIFAFALRLCSVGSALLITTFLYAICVLISVNLIPAH